jgi:hypothetical protein
LPLHLPLVGRVEEPRTGLAFDLLAGSGTGSPEPAAIITGHACWLITIDIAEADDTADGHGQAAVYSRPRVHQVKLPGSATSPMIAA